MDKLRRAAGYLVVGFVLALGAAPSCGARTGLPGDDRDGLGGDGAGGRDVGGERRCTLTCTVGHACCIGSCDGPSAKTETDCCECLANEVNSVICPGAVCGGD